MAKLTVGSAAPDFSLPDQQGRLVSLSDFAGRKVLIYFYPKADTPGCTQQACACRDAAPALASSGLSVVGISPDPEAKQARFDTKYELGFQLLADVDHAVAEAYGVWAEKKNFGKVYMGIVRSAFLVDEAGRLSQVWYKVKPLEMVTKALDAL